MKCIAAIALLVPMFVVIAAAPRVPPHPDWRNALAPSGAPGAALTLSREGKTAYDILVPAEPTSVEQKAAADLAKWLGEMTGASFAVVREVDSASDHVISIGATKRLATANVGGGQIELAREGYGLDVKEGDLFLWGGGGRNAIKFLGQQHSASTAGGPRPPVPRGGHAAYSGSDTVCQSTKPQKATEKVDSIGGGRGPINAVYAFLEEDLGCRWYQRGTATIPQRSTLVVRPVPRTFVPALEIRDPYYWDAFDADWSLRNRTNAPSARVPDEFGGRIRYAGGFFVHTYNRLVPPKTYFKDHPEYFSEIGGKRQPRQLCLSNPDVLRISIEKVRAVLRADPTAQLISISPNDGRGYCECAKCRALDDAEGGTHAATLLTFVNAVADAIRDEFPQVKVSTLAYLGTVQPAKTIRPRDNVVIRLCTDRHAWSHFFEFVTETDEFSAAMKAWAEIGAQIHIWDYTVNFSHYSLPQPNLPIVSQNIRWLIHHNARGIMLQGAYQSPGAARGPLRCWVWGKQLWNPALNTRDLVRDFTYGFYGEAAEPMQSYNDLLWRLWEREYMGQLRAKGIHIRYPPDAPFLGPGFAAEATRLFAAAESLAKTPEVHRRVALAKFALLYLKLARGPGFVAGDDFSALCDDFETIAKRESIHHLWEGGGGKKNQVETKLAYWRGLAAVRNAKFTHTRIGPESMFRPDPDGIGEKERWFDPAFADLEWARILCGEPGGWNRQGFPKLIGDAWYRLRFDVPADFGAGRKIRLFIGAADEDCIVYLNGKQALDHSCAATKLAPEQIWEKPILFDPTPFLKPGAENSLVLKIHNRLGMGGVWKPIYLLACDEEPNPDLVIDMVKSKGE